MPTYEFRCPDGTIVERVFKMSDVPESIPSPNGDGVAVRIISGGADLIFKGSGFYITDYGKDGKKDQRESAKKSDAKSSEGGDAKKDTAAKSDSAKGESAKSDSAKSDSAKTDSASKSSSGDKPSGSGPASGAAA